MIDIIIQGQPVRITEQQHRFGGYSKKNGKAIIYRNKSLKAAYTHMIEALAEYAPAVPISGPVRLEVDWCFGTKDKKKLTNSYKTTRPDTDNLIKGLKDCLTKCGFWVDDSQVCIEILIKSWCPLKDAHTRIQISEL